MLSRFGVRPVVTSRAVFWQRVAKGLRLTGRPAGGVRGSGLVFWEPQGCAAGRAVGRGSGCERQ